MKLTLRRYSWILMLQFALLGVDLFFNAFGASLARNRLQTAILFFVIQDVLIIAEYVLFTFTLHSTCVHQVGASHIILRNCKLFLISVSIYFLLSASQHFWIVSQYRLAPGNEDAEWPLGLIALSVTQRIVSVFYYYSCKSTALTMADPRFKEEYVDWIAEQLGDK
ncbi:transmembrane protein 138 [Drosophila bipectinata]|uniref:transmembrane protein 138 n=1 Tax=Drosophila bipectinata TaxID=42026 RepID=UPI0007E635B4|nr:transmembrane protein 138 [Drosophila bipectinata]